MSESRYYESTAIVREASERGILCEDGEGNVHQINYEGISGKGIKPKNVGDKVFVNVSIGQKKRGAVFAPVSVIAKDERRITVPSNPPLNIHLTPNHGGAVYSDLEWDNKGVNRADREMSCSFEGMKDALYTMVQGHATEGIDVTKEAYVKGVQYVIDSMPNRKK